MPNIHLSILVDAHAALDRVMKDPRVPAELMLSIASITGQLGGVVKPILEAQVVSVDMPSGGPPITDPAEIRATFEADDAT